MTVVELDLTATLEAMLQHQAAGVGVDLATVPAEAIEYNRRVLLELLQVALPPLTEAIVDQLPNQGWLYVPDCTDEDLAKLGLRRNRRPAPLLGPHSRACGIIVHAHGSACHPNCPTCGDMRG